MKMAIEWDNTWFYPHFVAALDTSENGAYPPMAVETCMKIHPKWYFKWETI